jgi:hypothetical protein
LKSVLDFKNLGVVKIQLKFQDVPSP